jgi:hypothetical protein
MASNRQSIAFFSGFYSLQELADKVPMLFMFQTLDYPLDHLLKDKYYVGQQKFHIHFLIYWYPWHVMHTGLKTAVFSCFGLPFPFTNM